MQQIKAQVLIMKQDLQNSSQLQYKKGLKIDFSDINVELNHSFSFILV